MLLQNALEEMNMEIPIMKNLKLIIILIEDGLNFLKHIDLLHYKVLNYLLHGMVGYLMFMMKYQM
jgi:hypothetical protein